MVQDATLGSLLLGEISYGQVSIGNKGGNGGAASPAKSTISFVVPPPPKVCFSKLHYLMISTGEIFSLSFGINLH